MREEIVTKTVSMLLDKMYIGILDMSIQQSLEHLIHLIIYFMSHFAKIFSF